MNFKPIRRVDREISKDEALSLLKLAEYGVLSLAQTENEYPYGVPIDYIFYEDNLYFHCATEGQKLDILKINNKACFTVVLDAKVLPRYHSTAYKSVIVFGRCTLLNDNLKDEMLLKFGMRFAGDFPEVIKETIQKTGKATTIIKFEIDYVSGKQRKDI
ncbi:MAG: pyridoxamine 5'-phosphate oxidase family protein [Desulfitobacterium hafniense]|nr:pyridoxamine 5'-phosphate oxidase family protein [Desulfitobacterium hafniense]